MQQVKRRTRKTERVSEVYVVGGSSIPFIVKAGHVVSILRDGIPIWHMVLPLDTPIFGLAGIRTREVEVKDD